jgi:nitrogen PTS system EIIA component
MEIEQLLENPLVLPGLGTNEAAELLARVAAALCERAGLPQGRIESVFLDAMQAEGFSLGNGVAIPHAEIEGLPETQLCVATTRAPLPLPTIDGKPADIFFFILSRPDEPERHLLLLARIARLCQSRTLLEGIRRASSAEEVLALIRAARLRHAPATLPPLPAAMAGRVLVVIALGGEKVVDAVLVDLLDQGFEDATILEAQSLGEATTRELPLFTGFRDIFGDPGGRRVIFLETEPARTKSLIETVRRACANEKTKEAHVSVIPLALHWSPADDAAASGSEH